MLKCFYHSHKFEVSFQKMYLRSKCMKANGANDNIPRAQILNCHLHNQSGVNEGQQLISFPLAVHADMTSIVWMTLIFETGLCCVPKKKLKCMG